MCVCVSELRVHATCCCCCFVNMTKLQAHDALAAAAMSSLPGVLQQQGLGQVQVTVQGLSTFRNQVGAS